MDHSWGYGSEQRLRNENQDSYGVFDFPDFTLAVVCDGMGGHVGGAQASSLAVRTIHDTLETTTAQSVPEKLEEALQLANQAIYEAARRNHRLMGMGTTVVAAAVTDEVAYLAHVGDSRAYLVRQGQVTQLTRDHTMVNLFVDAELLTPEDAATHPEAHVLSRSLGVERQVEVELSEPIALQPEDVIFLCSDGVHGVLTDWELGNVDWGAPHEGIRHILDIVIAREGDDNSTAVSVLCATSFEDVPPTPVPEVRRVDETEAPQAGGVTAVPVEEEPAASPLYADDPRPTPLPQQRSGYDQGASDLYVQDDMDYTDRQPLYEEPPPRGGAGGGDPSSYVVYENEQAPAPVPDANKDKPIQRAGQSDDEKKARAARRRMLVVGVGAAAVLCAGFGATSLLLGGGGAPAVEGAPEVIQPASVGADEQQAIADLEGPNDLLPAEPEPEVNEDRALFDPELPPPPRRLPHRPTRYTQPPPGGPTQWEAVQAARMHECRRSLDAVMKGMSMSVDHATLYSQAWFCFDETHQRPLSDAVAQDWEDFILLVHHFEGTAEDRMRLETEEQKRLPFYYRKAVDGLEYRLEAWANADESNLIDKVLSDILGDPTIADHLSKDLLLEAEAARGLSHVRDPNERVVDMWSRRVYVLAWALNGAPGRLLKDHRPEVVPILREALEDATTPHDEYPVGEDGEPDTTREPVPSKVPDVILEAKDVGYNLKDPPTTVKKAPKPTGPKKPVVPDVVIEDDRPAKVHGGRGN